MQALPGRCFACQRTFPQAAMAEHLLACRPQHDGQPLWLFHIQDNDFPDTFWLFVEIAPTAPLAALDHALRQVWVDCCGHYSQFVIGGETYARRPNPDPVALVLDEHAARRTMDVPLAQVFTVGAAAAYAYDEIWPTELRVRLLAEYAGQPLAEGGFRVAARNYKPPRTCRLCARPAAWLYTDTWPLEPYCDRHARQHPAWGQEDAFLPYVNSPRVGLCTYRGPADEALRFEVEPPAS